MQNNIVLCRDGLQEKTPVSWWPVGLLDSSSSRIDRRANTVLPQQLGTCQPEAGNETATNQGITAEYLSLSYQKKFAGMSTRVIERVSGQFHLQTNVTCALFALASVSGRRKREVCFFFDANRLICTPMIAIWPVLMAFLAARMKHMKDAFDLRSEMRTICVANLIATGERMSPCVRRTRDIDTALIAPGTRRHSSVQMHRQRPPA